MKRLLVNLKILYKCFNQNHSLLSCSTDLNSVQFSKCSMSTYYSSDNMQRIQGTEWRAEFALRFLTIWWRRQTQAQVNTQNGLHDDRHVLLQARQRAQRQDWGALLCWGRGSFVRKSSLKESSHGMESKQCFEGIWKQERAFQARK